MLNVANDPSQPPETDGEPRRSKGVSSTRPSRVVVGYPKRLSPKFDIYFSVDVETDGPIPGPFSMLSFAIAYAGAYDGQTFYKPPSHAHTFYKELVPISERFEQEALDVNGLDRSSLLTNGANPVDAMTEAAAWIRTVSGSGSPVIVAYPLSFDWSFLYWYFVQFSETGSPFGFSRAFDIKTAVAVSLKQTIVGSGRMHVPDSLKSDMPHTHNALDDALEQADIFQKVFLLGINHE